MPHAIIDYSGNIEADIRAVSITSLVHQTLGRTGLFPLERLKTRAYKAEDYMVGQFGTEGSFLHVSLFIMEGRTLDQKKTVSDALIAALDVALPHVQQLTVDIRDMTKDCYGRRDLNAL